MFLPASLSSARFSPTQPTRRSKVVWGHRRQSASLPLAILIAMVLSVAFTATAHAQEFVAVDRATVRDAAYTGILTATEGQVRVAVPRLAPAKTLPNIATRKRPMALPALYVTLGVVQGADLYTTSKALQGGAREANPIMGLMNTPAKAIALKAVTTAGIIYLTEKLWKENRVAAVVLLAAVNGFTASVAVHNSRVTAGMAAARR